MDANARCALVAFPPGGSETGVRTALWPGTELRELTDREFMPVYAVTEDEFLRIGIEKSPSLVIIRQDFPGRYGAVLARILRQECGRIVPVVLYVGNSRPEGVYELQQEDRVGVTWFVYERADLASVIRQAINDISTM